MVSRVMKIKMIAHMRKDDYVIQTVQEHLNSVAALAKVYGKKVGFSAMAELAGFLHDMGKNSEAFRVYIVNAVKETGEPLERIDHSTAGAKFLYETYYNENPSGLDEVIANITIEIIGMVILSHHSGLQNFIQTDGSQSDYFRRVLRGDLPCYEEVKVNFLAEIDNKQRVDELFNYACKEVKTLFNRIKGLLDDYNQEKGKLSYNTFLSIALKYVFSCLIDADRTDSRRFDENDMTSLDIDYTNFFASSYQHLMNRLDEWKKKESATKPINQLRREMSERCDKLASDDSAIFQLSIPTGGGKTLASLRYALKHAIEKKKDRIIYVVPYTTILEQNAEAVRSVIKNKDLVLEHHANVMDESDDGIEEDYYRKKTKKKIQLARDNWDYPIIFTTMVQFMDTLYAKGTRKSRRLHNLANSIIIFDEVQSVPVKHIPLFNGAVNFLHYFGNSSIILCTATQPTLNKTEYPLLVENQIEMIEDLPNVVKAFERVSIENRVTNEGWSAEEISEFTQEVLTTKQSVLIILNTKKAVLNVYKQLKEIVGENVYHLSTSMCPQHRKDILEKVRLKLDASHEKIICISTQLIEAGVDISFQTVIRSLAGIDSIAQAAGRCNRHAELEKGIVYIIRAKDESLSRLPEIALGQKVTAQNILSRKHLEEDMLSPKAIQTYFDFYLRTTERELMQHNKDLGVPLIDLLNGGGRYHNSIPPNQPKTIMKSMYKTLESHFEVIEAPTTGILVPYTCEGRKIIATLNEEINDYNKLNEYLKKAQLYSVNVYTHTLHQLVEAKLIYPLYTEGVYALQENGYHEKYGLSLEGEGTMSIPLF